MRNLIAIMERVQRLPFGSREQMALVLDTNARLADEYRIQQLTAQLNATVDRIERELRP